jgi:hypothetical protein
MVDVVMSIPPRPSWPRQTVTISMRAAAKGLAFISGVMFHFVRLIRRRES